jgi:predicted KAP-like P-loop ATPase
VTIDDLDRLEPGEAVEILRLMRAVADFPNVVYIACFDRDVLADAVANTLHIEDGSSFLEKIFQATVTVPSPDGFDLRHWLQSELSALIALGGPACQPTRRPPTGY